MVDPNKLYRHWDDQDLDLEKAKKWIHKWVNEWDQVLPWDSEPIFTSRAMAGHLSNFLEGGKIDTGYAIGEPLSYIDTQYGSELYFAAWT